MKTIGILLSLFFSLFLITSVYAQTERDLESEYCSKNWIVDQIRCVEYIPDDYPENPEYELLRADIMRVEEAQQAKSEQESERVCPLGSHITTDNQGNQICVDATGQFTGYPNIDGGLGDTGTLIGVGIVIVIIIIAVIAIAKRKSLSLPEESMSLPRRGWTDSQHKEIMARQGGVCANCGEHSGSFQFDHIDGNSNNNDINNAQGLCPNCHDRKSRGLD